MAGRNGLNVLQHGPLNLLRAGGRSQRAVVAPEFGVVELLEEVSCEEWAVCSARVLEAAILNELFDEIIINVTAFIAIEKHTEYGTKSHVALGIVLSVLVDEVHLQIVHLTVDSVLGGSVNVGLQHSELVFSATIEGELHLTAGDSGMDS